MDSPFSIFILNASGERLGSGPLTTVTQLSDTRRLDAIGEVSFSFPNNDPRSHLITEGSQFDIYDAIDGYLGRFIFVNDGLNESKRLGEISIRANDSLDELRRETVGFRRKYEFEPVNQVIEDLMLLVSGWGTNAATGIGNTTVTYEGESVFAAIDVMRDRWKQHFRLEPNQILGFGEFGESSGIQFVDIDRMNSATLAGRRYLGLVDRIRRNRDASEIYNVIIPVGGGQGEAQLTIQGATAGDYTIQTALNRDGSNYYYIQDDESIAAYGRRVRIVTFTQINPLSNNDTDILRARNALKLAAEAYLEKNKEPKTEYDITVKGLQQFLNVGDKARLTFRGVNDDGVYLDVDDEFYIMDYTRNRSNTGERSTQFTITSTSERRTTDQDVLVDVVRDLDVLKLHIQPYPFWSENTWQDTIQASDIDADNKQAEFKIEIDDSVTYVNKVRIRFKTKPPYTLSNNGISLNYPTSFYSGADPHQHFLPEGNINEKYQITVADYIYPVNLSLEIDGVDVTSQLGGPWAASENVAPVDVSLDITDLIQNSPSGLYGDHTIVFTAGIRRGAVHTPNSATEPITDDNASQGWVELNVRVQGVAQAIIPS